MQYTPHKPFFHSIVVPGIVSHFVRGFPKSYQGKRLKHFGGNHINQRHEPAGFNTATFLYFILHSLSKGY